MTYFERHGVWWNCTGGAAARGRWGNISLTFFLGRVSVNFIKAFLSDESGATMIEYGLVAALVSVAAIIALQILGAELQVIFNTVSSYLSSASGGGGS